MREQVGAPTSRTNLRLRAFIELPSRIRNNCGSYPAGYHTTVTSNLRQRTSLRYFTGTKSKADEERREQKFLIF